MRVLAAQIAFGIDRRTGVGAAREGSADVDCLRRGR